MLNYLWSFMILAGMLWGAANGNLNEVTQGLIDSAKDAVTLGITMLGIMSFWCGIMEVGTRAGLIDWLTGRMGPLLDFLFPDIGRNHPARRPIAVNIVANVLGLGMAATPAGLEAMRAMAEGQAVNDGGVSAAASKIVADDGMSVERAAGDRVIPMPVAEDGSRRPVVATNSMCTFLILNISSLQLIPVNMIAYRSQYGSVNPSTVLGPALVATACSTVAAVVFCKGMDRGRKRL